MKRIMFAMIFCISNLFSTEFFTYINDGSRFMYEKLSDQQISNFANAFSSENLEYTARLIVRECEQHDLDEDFLPDTRLTCKNVRAWHNFCDQYSIIYYKQFLLDIAEKKSKFGYPKALNLIKQAYSELCY